MNFTFDEALRAKIHARLSAFDDRRVAPGSLTHAAVALTLIGTRKGACFLLTRRTSSLRAHAGQFALPGGRVDLGESAIEAALRELDEEMGVTLGPANVLGLLDDYPTRSGYRITPVVMWAGGQVAVRAEPGEVAKVHYVTLERLARDDTPEFSSIPQSDRPLIRLKIAGAKVHAPTAAMIYQFREVAIFGRDTRVDHLEQPVFAWK